MHLYTAYADRYTALCVHPVHSCSVWWDEGSTSWRRRALSLFTLYVIIHMIHGPGIQVVVDLSRAAAIADMRPSRVAVIGSILQVASNCARFRYREDRGRLCHIA